MAENPTLAFLQQALSVSGPSAPVEETALYNLFMQRLIASALTIDASGNIAGGIVPNVTNATGTLPAAHGGTGLATLPIHGVLVGNATGTVSSVAVGTTGTVLQGNTGADPTWGAAGTGTVTHTAGALTANALVVGAGAADEAVLASLGTTTTVLHGNAAGLPTFGAVSLTADVSGITPTANGGTGIAFFTAAGPSVARVFTFPDAAASVLTTNAAVTVPQGGTGLATLTANNVILGNGASAPTFVAPSTSGNLLASNGTTWASTAPTMSLLHEASGTSTTAVPVNVDTYALASQLTAKDQLIVYVRHYKTAATGVLNPVLYNSTDAVTIAALTDPGTTSQIDRLDVGQGGTAKLVFTIGLTSAYGVTRSTFTQNWTGAWSIALRNPGNAASDPWVWEWTIYKLAGQ